MGAENFSSKNLALDIQKNVDMAILNQGNIGSIVEFRQPNTAEFASLQKDAQLLDGHPLYHGGNLVNDKGALQTAVQQELDQLEAAGTLPRITIDANGTIEGTVGLNGAAIKTGIVSSSPTLREMFVSPDQAPVINDLQPLTIPKNLPVIPAKQS